jgi:homoserine kinase
VSDLAVRVPASSANLGAGFDVLALAVDLHAELGVGRAPDTAHQLDRHHPAAIAFAANGGRGPLWMRSSIPMGRGLGFSGVARVGGAALAVIGRSGGDPAAALAGGRDDVVRTASTLEGHADNVAASVHGGIVAAIDGRVARLRVGPTIGGSSLLFWVPTASTSTDRSRAALPTQVDRADAVHNLARVAQFVLAVEHDDPSLLDGATDDRLHQPTRLPSVPGAADALEAGVRAGAWCGWLSGSGPSVAFLVGAASAPAVAAALPVGGRSRTLGLDLHGTTVATDV